MIKLKHEGYIDFFHEYNNEDGFCIIKLDIYRDKGFRSWGFSLALLGFNVVGHINTKYTKKAINKLERAYKKMVKEF